ncbi:MAG: methylated-DNA--[protein]-cysteine S-methyltransferase [Ruminococcaceae bacterium]|nr:methylated-DNA--[protein]-cysteine S-methyltransferase [Oscillospiraceae bacterium]
MFYYDYYDSPVGRLTVAGDERNIVGLWLAHQRFYMDVLQGKECEEKETEVIRLAKRWLDRYFDGEKPEISELSIKFIGSDFRVLVWQMLAEIPYGKVITYGDLAKRIAEKRGIKAMSAQAVGGAVGRNPISIIVPCHRVIGANGSMVGYSGGVSAKIKLLELEGTGCDPR